MEQRSIKFSFDRINDLVLSTEFEPSIERIIEDIPVPGSTAQSFPVGMGLPVFPLEGNIVEKTPERAMRKAQQLFELGNNLGYPFHVIKFPVTMIESLHNGIFIMRSPLTVFRNPGDGESYSFKTDIQRIASFADWRIATKWTPAAPEVFTGWGSLVSAMMVSLPNGVANIGETVLETRTGREGSNQIIDNPIKSPILYSLGADLETLNAEECKVFDAMGSADESEWQQVYSCSHPFVGDIVIQNGLLRYVISSNVGTFYAWDNITVPNVWRAAGQLKTAFSGNLDAAIYQIGITKLTSEYITWQELRQNGAKTLQTSFVLRRGAYFCKCSLQTFNTGIDTGTYVRLYSGNNATAYFAQLFNSQVNGAAGGGDLAQDTVTNYEMGYSTTRNLLTGFALLDQPTKQPYDSGAAGHSLAESNTWLANQLRSFFIISIPFNTSGTLANFRTKTATTTYETLQNVIQKLVLVKKGQHSTVDF